MFSKFRPTEVSVRRVEDISQLLQYMPSSVQCLHLEFAAQNLIQTQNETPRKFKILTLQKCKQILEILSKHATATESLTIDSECLDEPGVIDYLTQMDCQQVIIIQNEQEDKLIEFFNRQSKAQKYI
ncbi:hypothetical protein FGO68_gene358 [Halteria grandinella]|uniref:Uncharacterized protein n=1 Tax=Halteria grandinella TaxID=5974 RepID=A0A8J8NYF3_HALGN|nr:hypothetical protein FGO68_gene358 [Halteria grandinella]